MSLLKRLFPFISQTMPLTKNEKGILIRLKQNCHEGPGRISPSQLRKYERYINKLNQQGKGTSEYEKELKEMHKLYERQCQEDKKIAKNKKEK